MQKLEKTIAGLALFTVVATGGAAHAAVLSVDPSGGQYATITGALTAANDYDTIVVAAGDYDEPVNINKAVTLQGSGPQTTTLKKAVTVSGVGPVKITGFQISTPGDGISITGRTPTDIFNNLIVGNSGAGIHVNVTSVGGSFVVDITNNTITSNGKKGIEYYTYNSSPPVNISNNIITFNGSQAFSAATAWFIVNNVLYGNFGTVSSGCTVNYCGTVNLADNQLIDPLFVDQGSFTLAPSSPAKNTGKVGAAYLNPDGTRNDVGAYGGPGAASFWPYGYGPAVTRIAATPQRVPQGGTITINATATVR